MSDEKIQNLKLAKIISDALHLIDEFIAPKNCSSRNCDEYVAPFFRKETEV